MSLIAASKTHSRLWLRKRRFVGQRDGAVVETVAHPDRLAHGSVIARTIADLIPEARFLAAQIFHDRMVTTPAAAAAGLDWLCKQGARIVTMSFGLRADRDVLRTACARAHEAGVILLASSPARGGPVFPAAYPDVIAVSGDARLAPGEISALDPERPVFGAHSWPSGVDGTGKPIAGGASFAVATAAAIVARALVEKLAANSADVVAYLRANARYHGAERRK